MRTDHVAHALLGEEGGERRLDSKQGQASEATDHVGAAAGRQEQSMVRGCTA